MGVGSADDVVFLAAAKKLRWSQQRAEAHVWWIRGRQRKGRNLTASYLEMNKLQPISFSKEKIEKEPKNLNTSAHPIRIRKVPRSHSESETQI